MSNFDCTLPQAAHLQGMDVISVSKLLKKIDDLRSAADAAKVLAEHFDAEERQSILQLAQDWEAQAKQEEDRIDRFSVEAEA